MSWRVGLIGCLLHIPIATGAQQSGIVAPIDSTALAVAVFRTAIVQGQLTAHGRAIPEVLCLATASRRAGQRYGEPDSIVVARVREQVQMVRPISACRIDPLQGAPWNTSLVVETATGRRGLVIWVDTPQRDSTGAVTVHIGYYEHGLSGADWMCAVRAGQTDWIVNACRMISIS
jgi:hypothetical protein